MSERLKALRAGDWYTFFANKQPKCPHCGSDFDIEQNEAWFLYDESDTHEVECSSCQNEFQVNSVVSWSFSTEEQEDDPDQAGGHHGA